MTVVGRLRFVALGADPHERGRLFVAFGMDEPDSAPRLGPVAGGPGGRGGRAARGQDVPPTRTGQRPVSGAPATIAAARAARLGAWIPYDARTVPISG